MTEEEARKKMPEGKIYTLEDGRKIWAHRKSCFFCRYCTDIYCELDGFPWGIACQNGKRDNISSIVGGCSDWEGEE